MNDLKKRLKEIAKMSANGMKQAEIARVIGVSRARIGQLFDKAEQMNISVVRKFPARMKKVKCPCGKIFECKESSKKIYHSTKCAQKLIQRPLKGGKYSRYEFVILTCDGCGLLFKRTNYLHQITLMTCRKDKPKKNFCTKKCYHESNRIK